MKLIILCISTLTSSAVAFCDALDGDTGPGCVALGKERAALDALKKEVAELKTINNSTNKFDMNTDTKLLDLLIPLLSKLNPSDPKALSIYKTLQPTQNTTTLSWDLNKAVQEINSYNGQRLTPYQIGQEVNFFMYSANPELSKQLAVLQK